MERGKKERKRKRLHGMKKKPGICVNRLETEENRREKKRKYGEKNKRKKEKNEGRKREVTAGKPWKGEKGCRRRKGRRREQFVKKKILITEGYGKVRERKSKDKGSKDRLKEDNEKKKDERERNEQFIKGSTGKGKDKGNYKRKKKTEK